MNNELSYACLASAQELTAIIGKMSVKLRQNPLEDGQPVSLPHVVKITESMASGTKQHFPVK